MSVFDTPQQQIDWAKSRIENAEALFRGYEQSDPFANLTEVDPSTGEELRIIRLVNPLPPDITGLLGNAIVDTKHSFDQSLFAAAKATGSTSFSKNYPWADTYNGVKGIVDKRQQNRDSKLPQNIVDEIFRQEPHGTEPGRSGGNDFIRDFAKMANDKHTIGFRVKASVTRYTVESLSISGGAGKFYSKWDQEKEELVLARMQPGTKFNYQDVTVSLNVFFKRTINIWNIDAFTAAKIFADHAQDVLNGFKAVSR